MAKGSSRRIWGNVVHVLAMCEGRAHRAKGQDPMDVPDLPARAARSRTPIYGGERTTRAQICYIPHIQYTAFFSFR